MGDKENDFLGCSSNVLHRNDRSNVVYCTEENWQSVALALSQVLHEMLILQLQKLNYFKLKYTKQFLYHITFFEGIGVTGLLSSLFE